MKADNVKLTKTDAIDEAIRKYCRLAKNTKENRFCYYIGGTDDAATGSLRAASGPLSRQLPIDKICEQLKKKDSQICELKYEEPIDLKTIDLDNEKVKTLKQILADQYGDPCKGCVEKADYIQKIKQYQAKEL